MSSAAADYAVERLHDSHCRAPFNCGVPELNRYLHQQAGQDSRRNVAVVYLLIHRASGVVAGYYTLANTAILATELPTDRLKKLPRYPLIPATLLGRLALDIAHRGLGLGEFLLLDVIFRSLELSRNSVSFAIVVDAKDERAAAFYRRYDFEPFLKTPGRLFLTMTDADRIFKMPPGNN